MHRDHFRLLKLLTLQVLALLVLAPFVWSQSNLYGVLVDGTATACKTKEYSKPCRHDETGSQQTHCGTVYKSSSAMSNSTADLNNDNLNGGVALTAYKSTSSAVARSITNDTVTLIPPSGYSQDSVDFKVKDAYSLAFDNNGGSGYAQLCWKAPELWAKPQCVQKYKSTQGDVVWPATLKKSATGFQFAIAKGVQLAASLKDTGSWEGDYTTSADPDAFEFEQDGWACTFASGAACEALGPEVQ